MMSGLAAMVVACIKNDQVQMAGADYQERLRASWVFTELKACRNIRPGFTKGLHGDCAKRKKRSRLVGRLGR